MNTGMKVALAENGPMGGTCLNRVHPSKMWIYPADIRQIEDGVHVGVNASLESADFETVRRRTWGAVLRERDHIFEAIKQDPRATLLQDTVRFIGDKTLQASDRTLRAPKIVIAGGARSAIPNIPGLDDVNYHTSETIFDITRLPQSMMIIGGGYKACEFGHFFSAFGTKVTILQRNVRLLPREELEMGDVVMRRLGKHVTIRTAYDVQEVRKSDGNVQVIGRDRQTMAPMRDEAELLLIGAGMKSNADWLDPTVTGVQLDERGYVVVNEHLETTAPGIWALGDITGRHMFRHTANYESRIVWYNLSAQNKAIIDEHAIPHAVYTYPTIGSVGMSENEVKKSGRKYLVGLSSYANVAKGEAMANNDGLVRSWWRLERKGYWARI